MTRAYSREPSVAKNAAKAKASSLRVHYKNTFEVVRSVKGMNLQAAQRYLKDVLNHKRCVPFTKFRGHVGRTGQAKEFGLTQGRWPQKSVKIVLGLLQNLEANATTKGLETEKLNINHAQVNQAQKGRRRTYRAHGRINPYLSSGCHIEFFAQISDVDVKKESKGSLAKKQIAKRRLQAGEQ